MLRLATLWYFLHLRHVLTCKVKFCGLSRASTRAKIGLLCYPAMIHRYFIRIHIQDSSELVLLLGFYTKEEILLFL